MERMESMLRSRMERAEERLIEQEVRSRRNNVEFHGVEERAGEDCVKIVKDLAHENVKSNGR